MSGLQHSTIVQTRHLRIFVASKRTYRHRLIKVRQLRGQITLVKESQLFFFAHACFDGFSSFHFAFCLHTFHHTVFSHDEHPFLCSLHCNNIADGICSIHSSIMQTIRQTKWTKKKTTRTKRITSESEIYFCLFFFKESSHFFCSIEIFLHSEWFWRIKNALNKTKWDARTFCTMYWRKYSLLDVIISFLCSFCCMLKRSFCLSTKRITKEVNGMQKLSYPFIKKSALEKHIKNIEKDVKILEKYGCLKNSSKGFITRTRFYIISSQSWWGKLKSTFQQICVKGKEFNCKDCAHKPYA